MATFLHLQKKTVKADHNKGMGLMRCPTLTSVYMQDQQKSVFEIPNLQLSHALEHSKSSAPGRELMHCVPYLLCEYLLYSCIPPQICDDPYGMVSTVLILFDIGYPPPSLHNYYMEP